MKNQKKCEQCDKMHSKIMFAPSGVCLGCAVKNDERANTIHDPSEYETVEEVGCAGGGCAL